MTFYSHFVMWTDIHNNKNINILTLSIITKFYIFYSDKLVYIDNIWDL